MNTVNRREYLRNPVGRSPVSEAIDGLLQAMPIGGVRSGILGATGGGAAIPDSVDSHWPIDEGSGTTQFDDGNTRDGSITGSTWTSLADAVGGFYLDHDVTDDIVSYGVDTFRFLQGSDYTMTAFIQVPNTTDNFDIFSWSTSSYGFDFRVNGGVLQIGHDGVSVVDGPNVSANSWAFVAVRYDNSTTTADLRVTDTENNGNNLGSMADGSGSDSTTAKNNNGLDTDEMTMTAAYLSDSDLDTLRNRRSDV